MGRELLIRAAVRGDPAEAQQRFLGDPGAWLPAPARWYGRQTWRVTLHAGPLTRPVACRVGSVWSI